MRIKYKKKLPPLIKNQGANPWPQQYYSYLAKLKPITLKLISICRYLTAVVRA